MTELMIRRQPTRRATAPLSLFSELENELERFVGGRLPLLQASTDQPWRPRVDVYEQDGKLMIEAELPGVKKEAIHVYVGEGGLTLRGELAEERETEDRGVYRCERRRGAFERWFPLDFDVESKKVEARFEDGILRISVPLPSAKQKAAHEIPVA
jgi:HSP20 family protein